MSSKNQQMYMLCVVWIIGWGFLLSSRAKQSEWVLRGRGATTLTLSNLQCRSPAEFGSINKNRLYYSPSPLFWEIVWEREENEGKYKIIYKIAFLKRRSISKFMNPFQKLSIEHILQDQ